MAPSEDEEELKERSEGVKRGGGRGGERLKETKCIKRPHFNLQLKFCCFVSLPVSKSSTLKKNLLLSPDLNYLATCLTPMMSSACDALGLDCREEAFESSG